VADILVLPVPGFPDGMMDKDSRRAEGPTAGPKSEFLVQRNRISKLKGIITQLTEGLQSPAPAD
jgi:hypothetical protein